MPTRSAVPTLLLAALVQLAVPAAAVNGRPAGASAGICDLSSTLEDPVSTLRIAAIFIILVSSTLGIVLPFLPQLASSRSAADSKARRAWDETFFVLKYAGAGVIVATAFVHLTYESFVELESPCINLIYKPLAPVLSMASLSLIFLVDCFLTRYLHRLRKKHNERSIKDDKDEELQVSNMLALGQTAPGTIILPPRKTKAELEKAEELERLEEERLDEKSREMEVMIIEGGIVFHSIMVGLGLGVSTDEGFVPYFVAITFHQFFDGCAIGTRMALLNFENKRMKQSIMFAAYAFVTPIGIAIGIGVRNTFQANDPTTILTIGVLNSLSAGVLLYGALVNLIAKDFLTGQMLEVSNRRLGVALTSLFIGAALMSLLGQWA